MRSPRGGVLGEIAGGQAADEAGRPDQDEVELTVRWIAHHCTLRHRSARTRPWRPRSSWWPTIANRDARPRPRPRPRRPGLPASARWRWQPRTRHPQQSAWRTEAIPVTLELIATGAFSVEGGQNLSLGEAAEAPAPVGTEPAGDRPAALGGIRRVTVGRVSPFARSPPVFAVFDSVVASGQRCRQAESPPVTRRRHVEACRRVRHPPAPEPAAKKLLMDVKRSAVGDEGFVELADDVAFEAAR